MALIKCKGCGKRISDKAVRCVHCNRPIDDIEIEEEEIVETYKIAQPRSTSRDEKDYKIIMTVLGVLALTVLIIMFIK